MNGQIHKAYKVMLKLINPKYVSKDKGIPLAILQKAKGIAFITSIKAGFVFTGTAGSGIVIARLDDGSWSGPSSMGLGGMGWGLQIGASSTDSVIILNTTAAVNAFAGKGQVKFGANLSVAAGPVGRDADASVNAGDGGIAACYSYSHSRGAFAGMSLQGAIMFCRGSDNKQFYGQSVNPTAILKGMVTPPSDCEDLQLLYKTLRVVTMAKDANMSYRDSQTGSIHFDDDNESDYGGSYRQSTSSYDGSMETLGPVAEEIDLPKGWQAVPVDGGSFYYWNQETNETTWDKPTLQAPVVQPPLESPFQTSYVATSKPNAYQPPAASVAQPPQESSFYKSSVNQPPAAAVVQFPQESSFRSTDNVASHPTTCPPPVPASSEWSELKTETGQVYYWNKKTNETKWENPDRKSSIPPSHQLELQRAVLSQTNISTPDSVGRPQIESRPSLAAPSISKRPMAPTSRPVSKPSESPVVPSMSYDQVLISKSRLDHKCLESYLTPSEFNRVFHMDIQAFQALPKWRKEKLKQEKQLF